jgi:GNAT superfamily N-acetyltransferase
MNYEISTEHERMQLDVIYEFLRNSYWFAGVRRDIVESARRNSAVVGVFDEHGNQVGYLRAVTDYATFAYLCDAFVLEPHRKRGLFGRMLETLFADPRLQTIRKWCLATWDQQDLYKKFGFEPVPVDRWLQIKAPPSVWQD